MITGHITCKFWPRTLGEKQLMKIPKTSITIISAVAILVMLCAATASASTIYNSRAAWNAQVTGVTTETFDALAGQEFQTLTLDDVTFDVPGYADPSDLWVSTPGSYTPGIDVALVGNHALTNVPGMLRS